MMKTVIVVPTYNEAENMPLLAEQIIQHLPEAHLLVMDDNSPDRTADICQSLFESRPEFRNYSVIRRSGVRGLGRAYRDGFQRALNSDYDRIIQMDADLSHDPARLPTLLCEADRFDLVIGSRYCPEGGVRNWPVRRIWLSRFACWYVQTIARVPIRDATGGYRCWSRRALEAVQLETLRAEGYSFQVEMLHRACQAGMKIAEIPIIFTDRQFGKSKISRTVLLESFIMPWRLRFKPWRPDEATVRSLAARE
jgi:dolichol-phosphate mannosyltransferase